MKNVESPTPDFTDPHTLSAALEQIAVDPWNTQAHNILLHALHFARIQESPPQLSQSVQHFLELYRNRLKATVPLCPEPRLRMTLEWILGLQNLPFSASFKTFLFSYATFGEHLGQVWSACQRDRSPSLHPTLPAPGSASGLTPAQRLAVAWHGLPELDLGQQEKAQNLFSKEWHRSTRLSIVPPAVFSAAEILKQSFPKLSGVCVLTSAHFVRPFSYVSKNGTGFIFTHTTQFHSVSEAAVFAHEAAHVQEISNVANSSTWTLEFNALEAELQFLLDHSGSVHNFFYFNLTRQAALFEFELKVLSLQIPAESAHARFVQICERWGLNPESFAPSDFSAPPLVSGCYFLASVRLWAKMYGSAH